MSTTQDKQEPQLGTGRKAMSRTTESQNKARVLEAFATLFNKRDYVAAERYPD
jgi:hypothetical protein